MPSFGAGRWHGSAVGECRVAAGAIGTPGGFFDSEGEGIGTKFAPKFIASNRPRASNR